MLILIPSRYYVAVVTVVVVCGCGGLDRVGGYHDRKNNVKLEIQKMARGKTGKEEERERVEVDKYR